MKMNIAYFSSEVFPYSKTGGLADVAGALPLALGALGHKIHVFTPLYKDISPQKLTKSYGYSRIHDNVALYFIKNDLFYKREGIYGSESGDYEDNLLRFSFFCKESLHIIQNIGEKIDLYHCNDWHTALIPILLRSRVENNVPFFRNSKSLFTIHNLAFQGRADIDKFYSLGLASKYRDVLDFGGQLNLLKGALLCSDAVNTVSPTHSREIRSYEYGMGLQYILQMISNKLSGIVNGIDNRIWNPVGDEHIFDKYSVSTAAAAKQLNKKKFCLETGLKPSKNGMLIGIVTRISKQKGIDLILDTLEQTLKHHSVVILGNGDAAYMDRLKTISCGCPQRLLVVPEHDESFAHKVFAASDVFLMPSRFEPCGLTQMIAMSYGTVPVVFPTGGIVDTVKPVTSKSKTGTGFFMNDYSPDSLNNALAEAWIIYKNRTSWETLQKRVMKVDNSWNRSARKYAALYEELLTK